jgi:hypothetical protein
MQDLYQAVAAAYSRSRTAWHHAWILPHHTLSGALVEGLIRESAQRRGQVGTHLHAD